MSRRWVVVSEDSFNELCKKQLEKAENIPDINSAEEEQEPVITPNTENAPVEEQETSAAASIQQLPNQKEENVRTIENLIPEHKWINQLPVSYRQSSERFLRQLEATGEFKVGEDGEIIIKGASVPNLNISTFLRITCIPFHKGQLPEIVRQWLRKKAIKVRNHKVKLAPNWINKFVSKKSTMARLLARYADQ